MCLNTGGIHIQNEMQSRARHLKLAQSPYKGVGFVFLVQAVEAEVQVCERG